MFKILNFNILGGFQKNEYFLGVKIMLIVFCLFFFFFFLGGGGHHKTGLFMGFFCAFKVFS